MSKHVRVAHAARILLGLVFLASGLNGFHTFIPVPPFHPFMQILVTSGYIYFIKIAEVVAGALLLANRAVLLALVLLGADIANIVLYHVLLDHRNWPAALIVAALYAFVVWEYRPLVRALLRWNT